MKSTLAVLTLILASACGPSILALPATSVPPASRYESLPSDVAKQGPTDDPSPPLLHSDEWLSPVPMPGPINTAGGEDSPFITPDGQLLFFFFTPDVRIPAERQLVDGVTGIYVSKRIFGGWSEPVRVILQDPGELSLDGCEFYQDGELWFCTVRTGLLREIDIWLADFEELQASNWRSAGEVLNLELGLGEFHFSSDWQTVVFHSEREGGQGGMDLYAARHNGDSWGEPENLVELNSSDSEGWPYLTPDGGQLFFSRFYQGSPAIFRSHRVGEQWSPPELILSQFAGEPTLDAEGNLYFVHHYYRAGVMIEADIYVAYKK